MSSSENPRPGTFFPAFFLIRRFARTIEAQIRWIVKSAEFAFSPFPISWLKVKTNPEKRIKK